MKQFSFLDFIREIGKHITVNYMMAKDSVKKRLSSESAQGMSFTEFTYQLVQGYDFLHLRKNYGCMLQMGGSDQWGNITTGGELIRRKEGLDAYGLTWPLMTKSDGKKFGKTESGNVWLAARYTSPYKFYQFWLNTTDEDAARYVKIFTILPPARIDALIAEPGKLRTSGNYRKPWQRNYLPDPWGRSLQPGPGSLPNPLWECNLRDLEENR
mgnify:CR=1 FL=1